MTRPSFRASARPKTETQSKQRGDQLTKRQYVRFAFYSIDPTWRRLAPQKQETHKRELKDTIEGFNRRMLLRPYSLMGTRADTELLLWQIAETPVPFQELAAAIMQTQMGAYLTLDYSYFSQTKRSIYEIRDIPGEDEERLVIQPTEAKYLFVYPFIKTRDWYMMSQHARQGMMDEHIVVGRKYPAVKLNTTYCFGIDDYEFIVAFETDEPSDFLDLVQELRETEASRFTKQDTPLFTCMNMRLEDALDALGGPAIAEPIEETQQRDVRVEVCPIDDLAPGETRVVYIDGNQVGLFNVDGDLYALSNRCPHARGPLTEGQVEHDEHGACTVICPWHYARFDLASGEVVDGIASTGVPVYQVDVEDGMIYVSTAKPDHHAASNGNA